MKRGLLLLLLAGLCGSCAFTKPENRHLVPLVEKYLVPEDPGARLLASPLWAPGGVAAGMLDVFVVHPALCIDDAYEDTMDALWREVHVPYVTYCGTLPFRVVATPVAFGADWFFRSMFPIKPYKSDERDKTPREAARDAREIEAFLAPLMSDNAAVRRGAAKRLGDTRVTPSDPRVVRGVVEACRKHEDDAAFCALVLRNEEGCWDPRDPKFIYRFAASRRGVFANARDFIELAIDLARRKEPALRRAALVTVFGFTSYSSYSYAQPDAHREIAVKATRSLYDLYAGEGDHASEMLCYDEFGTLSAEDELTRHVLFSLEKRGWPAYAGAVAFRLQAELLRERPEWIAHATANHWRAARGLKSDWLKRVKRLLVNGWPTSLRGKAEATARKVLGVREPTDAEKTLLLAHPEAVLKIAADVRKRPLSPERAADVRELVFELRTQADAMAFVDRAAGLSDADYALLCSSVGFGKLPRFPRRPAERP